MATRPYLTPSGSLIQNFDRREDAQLAISMELTNLGPLGSGAYGTVFQMQHRRYKAVVAVKLLSPGPLADGDTTETDALSRLPPDDSILSFRGALTMGPQSTPFALITAAYNGGDLNEIHPMIRDPFVPQGFIWHAIYSMGKAIAFIHSHGVVHNDLHKGNVLVHWQGTPNLHYPRLVLCDFGQSVINLDFEDWEDAMSGEVESLGSLISDLVGFGSLSDFVESYEESDGNPTPDGTSPTPSCEIIEFLVDTTDHSSQGPPARALYDKWNLDAFGAADYFFEPLRLTAEYIQRIGGR